MIPDRHHLYSRDCSKCGAPLAFIQNPEGRLIALDLKAPVFAVVEFKTQQGTIKREAIVTYMNFVSHYETCTHPDQFARRKERDEKEAGK